MYAKRSIWLDIWNRDPATIDRVEGEIFLFSLRYGFFLGIITGFLLGYQIAGFGGAILAGSAGSVLGIALTLAVGFIIMKLPRIVYSVAVTSVFFGYFSIIYVLWDVGS